MWLEMRHLRDPRVKKVFRCDAGFKSVDLNNRGVLLAFDTTPGHADEMEIPRHLPGRQADTECRYPARRFNINL